MPTHTSNCRRPFPELSLQVEARWAEHVYHQYTIRVVNRDRVQSALTEPGIGTTVYYPTPMHLQPVFAKLGYHEGDLPQAEQVAKEVLSLPIYAELTGEQIRRVVSPAWPDVFSSCCRSRGSRN
jgi:dTDP-4-amino-4,6-dideoxygalactose transaminase